MTIIDHLSRNSRGAYLFNTKRAAARLTIDHRKFSDWLYRTREMLRKLRAAHPDQLAAEFATIMAGTLDPECDLPASAQLNPRAAAKTLQMPVAKFSDWWQRTRAKLISLALDQPAATAAELLAILAGSN
jgi:hypothetical protein